MDPSIRERILDGLTDAQIQLVESHLRKRFETRKSRPGLGIVYDILHECNLQCRGCAVITHFVNQTKVLPKNSLKPSTNQIMIVLDKIHEYVAKQEKTCFINFGGGEPFLRPDLEEIVIATASYFGAGNVGVDTNGIVNGELDRIRNLAPYCSYIGISLDGLEEYHNWWRGGLVEGGAFRKTSDLITGLAQYKALNEILEVSSVATKKNLEELPKLMEFLKSIGVNRYSVHRSMAVGRMALVPELIPNSREYFKLLVALLDTANRLEMDVHLHHSIESIYATLLLDLPTYAPDRIGNPDAGSSLGLEPGGSVVFDPWSVSGIWTILSGGNLLDDGVKLGAILDLKGGSVLDLAQVYTSPNVRCRGCEYPCSGGNRISAASQRLIKKYKRLRHSEITESHILEAMTAVDPACPLYDFRMDGDDF